MIKLSDYVFKFIQEKGVHDIFLLPGGGCMHLVDSLGKNKNLNYICCLHEQTASLAACAYAQYTNNYGVALVTTGPGGTNAITGVAAAWIDSIPLIMISGQVKISDLSHNKGIRSFGFQEIDIVSIVKPITKYAITITDPLKIKFELEKAFFLAKNGRPGPVWLDIPLDIQASLINENELTSYENEVNNTYNEIPDNVIDEFINILQKSYRPIILAGYGVKIDNCADILIELINQLKIPLLTTWKAIDIVDDNFPYYFGRPGCIGQRCANFIIQNSDLLISIGARLDYGQIGYDHQLFAREAKKIIIDIDQNELNKFKFDIDFKICSSTFNFLNKLKNRLKKVDIDKINSNCKSWLDKCNEWKNKYPIIIPEIKISNNYVSTYLLIKYISELSNNDYIFTPGNSGACSEIFMQTFKVKKGQKVISQNGLGAMGTGLPSSLGACIASGRKTTICVNGDGGFQLNIQDLETIKRLNLPIKFFILNNNGYNSIRTTQKNYFNGTLVASDPSSGLTLPDIIKISKAYNIKSYKIKNNKMIKKILKKAFKYKGPVICDVIIDPNEQTLPRIISFITKEGKMKSYPLEDLYPFLDRNEFLSNMIVNPINYNN